MLFLVLRHFLFKPVTEYMQKRQDGIRTALKDADTKNDEADALKSNYQAKLDKADEEGREVIRAAATKAESRATQIIKDAEVEIVHMKEQARAEIEREREKALNTLKDEIASLAVLAASKVVERDMDVKNHKVFVEQFIDRVGDTKWQN